MAAPTVRWTCQRCRASNAGGTPACAACGLSLHGEARPASAALKEQATPRGGDEPHWIWSERALLIPELVLAGAVLLASPPWLILLALHEHYGAALVLLLGVAQAVLVGRASLRMKSAGGLHLTSWVILVSAAVAGWLSGAFA